MHARVCASGSVFCIMCVFFSGIAIWYWMTNWLFCSSLGKTIPPTLSILSSCSWLCRAILHPFKETAEERPEDFSLSFTPHQTSLYRTQWIPNAFGLNCTYLLYSFCLLSNLFSTLSLPRPGTRCRNHFSYFPSGHRSAVCVKQKGLKEVHSCSRAASTNQHQVTVNGRCVLCGSAGQESHFLRFTELHDLWIRSTTPPPTVECL